MSSVIANKNFEARNGELCPWSAKNFSRPRTSRLRPPLAKIASVRASVRACMSSGRFSSKSRKVEAQAFTAWVRSLPMKSIRVTLLLCMVGGLEINILSLAMMFKKFYCFKYGCIFYGLVPGFLIIIICNFLCSNNYYFINWHGMLK